MNRDTKKYLKEVRAEIPCSSDKKKQLMHAFLTSLENYLCDNPDAAYQDIVDAFGTPKEMADTLSENISESDARQYRRRKKLVLIFSVLLLCIILSLISYKLYQRHIPAEIVRTIVVYE